MSSCKCSLRLSLPVQLLQKAHKDSDHTVVIAVAYIPKFTMLSNLCVLQQFLVFPMAAIADSIDRLSMILT